MTVKIVVNRRGVRELLRGPEIQRDLTRRAQRVAAAAGAGYEVHSEVGRNRARAAVSTDTIEAMIAESRDHRLLYALDAAR